MKTIQELLKEKEVKFNIKENGNKKTIVAEVEYENEYHGMTDVLFVYITEFKNVKHKKFEIEFRFEISNYEREEDLIDAVNQILYESGYDVEMNPEWYEDEEDEEYEEDEDWGD